MKLKMLAVSGSPVKGGNLEAFVKVYLHSAAKMVERAVELAVLVFRYGSAVPE